MRSRTYSQLVLLWHALRDWMAPAGGEASQAASPLLVYIVTVLAFLLAILEIDAHRDALQALGFVTDSSPVPPLFVGP